MLVIDDIHILTISETQLDNDFGDTVVAIQGYNIYRKYRNDNGGGVADYIKSNIPVKIREDLMLNTVEVIWLQKCLIMFEMLDNVCDIIFSG